MKLTNSGPAHLVAAALLLGFIAGPVAAHDAWIEAQGDRLNLYFGHPGKPETAVSAKVTKIAALDARGRPIKVRIAPDGSALRVHAVGAPTLVTATYDNGYWSKTAEGSKNLPKDQVPGTLSATHAVKFAKTVLAWNAHALKPVGQRLEIVPLAAPANGTLPVQVLWEGKPLAGAKITQPHAPEAPMIQTDAAGKANVPVNAGRQMLSVNQRQNVAGDPKTDVYSAEANLVFTGL